VEDKFGKDSLKEDSYTNRGHERKTSQAPTVRSVTSRDQERQKKGIMNTANSDFRDGGKDAEKNGQIRALEGSLTNPPFPTEGVTYLDQKGLRD
jgi:hypothetical protein